MREDKSLSLILYQKSENLSQYILLNNKNMFKVSIKDINKCILSSR